MTVASAGERLPASGLSGAAISAVLPVALRPDVGRARAAAPRATASRRGAIRSSLRLVARRAPALAIASVLVPLLAGAAPLVVLVTGFLVTAALGVPLAFTLALTSLTYLLGIGGVSLIILPIKILGGVDSFVLLAIPLFILAGALMESGGISERIVDLAMAIVGRVRGGLAMVVVVAEILFSGISGSTAADVSAISSLLVPSMRRAGYSGPESVSVVAAASAMGILVPPCLTMVVLGSLVNLSIVTLFLAGFLPAFVLAARAARADRAARAPAELAGQPARRERRSGCAPCAGRPCRPGCRCCCSAASSAGSTTVTEAALLAVVYALVAGTVDGRHSPRRDCSAQLAQSGIVTATTLWVLAAASAFAWILVREWVPQMLGEWIAGIGAGRAGFLAMTVVSVRRHRRAARRAAGAPDLRADPLPDQPRCRHRSRPLRHRHHRGDGHRVLPAAGRRRPVDRRRHRARGHRRREPGVPAVPVALLVGLALIAAFPVLTLVLPRLFLGYRG